MIPPSASYRFSQRKRCAGLLPASHLAVSNDGTFCLSSLPLSLMQQVIARSGGLRRSNPSKQVNFINYSTPLQLDCFADSNDLLLFVVLLIIKSLFACFAVYIFNQMCYLSIIIVRFKFAFAVVFVIIKYNYFIIFKTAVK